MNELELTVSRTIPAPREQVFKAWLTPSTLAKFMRPPGTLSSKVTSDPVKGGRFSIVMTTQEKDIPHAGTYLEIDPHSRIAFTWESPFSQDDSVVTVDLLEIDPQTTEVTLRHVKFRSEQARDGHKAGWSGILEAMSEMFASAPSSQKAGA